MKAVLYTCFPQEGTIEPRAFDILKQTETRVQMRSSSTSPYEEIVATIDAASALGREPQEASIEVATVVGDGSSACSILMFSRTGRIVRVPSRTTTGEELQIFFFL